MSEQKFVNVSKEIRLWITSVIIPVVASVIVVYNNKGIQEKIKKLGESITNFADKKINGGK